MGWFEEQIKQRRKKDQQMFEDSFFRAAGVVLGKSNAVRISDEYIITKQAIDDILKYYHMKPVEYPKSIKTHEEQLDYCLRPYGIMKRQVTLSERWYRDSYGPILAYTQKLILDLSAVKYISSAGIRVLLGAYRAMEEKDGVLLRRPSDKVMEVLDLTGLTDAFEIEQYDNDE